MKEIFYLVMHSIHFILWLYIIGHMVKDHSDSKRGNLLLPHGLFLLLMSMSIRYNMHIQSKLQ